MSKRDHLIGTFLNIATALLDQILAEERKADPEEADAIARALGGGCMVNLRTSLAPSTGVCMLDVELAYPSGETHPLLSIEMQRQVAS